MTVSSSVAQFDASRTVNGHIAGHIARQVETKSVRMIVSGCEKKPNWIMQYSYIFYAPLFDCVEIYSNNYKEDC
jgi:hypothetical protein